MPSPDRRAALAASPRFALWVAIGALVGLVTLVLLTPGLVLLLGVVLLAATRPGGRTPLGGALLGLALPVAYVGSVIGAIDRTCNVGGIDAAGVETCTEWAPAGSIRWPWFLAAATLLLVGLGLQLRARRDARRALEFQEQAARLSRSRARHPARTAVHARRDPSARLGRDDQRAGGVAAHLARTARGPRPRRDGAVAVADVEQHEHRLLARALDGERRRRGPTRASSSSPSPSTRAPSAYAQGAAVERERRVRVGLPAPRR